MSSPAADPGPESGAGARYEACMDALRTWRDGMVVQSRIPLGSLNATHLRNALVRGRRDERLIAPMLPATYAHLAADIVNVIMATDPVSRPPQARRTTAEELGLHAAPDNSPRPATPPAQPPAEQPPRADDPMARPAPSAAPAAPPRPAARTEEQLAELARHAKDFAELNFTEEIGEPTILRSTLANQVVTLSWDAVADTTLGTVFRIVSTDDYPGYAPEFAQLIDITSNLTTVDGREFSSAVRYHQVWRNSGASWQEAVAGQPRLHAQSVMVAPIQNLTLREDGGRVIGQWAVFPGVNRVHVYRIPIERAAQAGQDPQFLIATEDVNLSGFIDRDATRGKRYLYRFYAEATVDGVARLSTAVGHTVAVSALLSPVDDLTVDGHGTPDDWLFDLTWSDPPAGRVVIYRTQAAPFAGLGDEARDESALPGGGLNLDDRLAHPTTVLEPGRTGMREVPSPVDWDRVYFTPVTLIEGKARVGTSSSQVVIPVPEDLVIVERTQHQLLKFGWPGDAAGVAVGLGPRGGAAAAPQEGPGYQEISRDTYKRLGGLQFPQPLPSHGCSVHVAGMSFVNRERIFGAPAVADYPGLLRLGYTLELKRTFLQKPDRLLIRVTSAVDLNNCPPFVIVFNTDRLPLHLRDGECLPVAPNDDEGTEAKPQFHPRRLGPSVEAVFRVGVRGRVGYVRVFPDIPPELLSQVAVLDPPVSSLTLRA